MKYLALICHPIGQRSYEARALLRLESLGILIEFIPYDDECIMHNQMIEK